MCMPSPLEIYADQICLAAKSISLWCRENGEPQPSFGVPTSSRAFILPPKTPEHILVKRQELMEACYKIRLLVTEPNSYLNHLSVHYQLLSSVHWLCHFGIFSCIPLDKSISFSEVAALAEVPENQLKAISRMAMTANYLCEPQPDRIAHTPASALFVTNPAVLDWALFIAKGSAVTASKMVEATEKWRESSSLTQTAFNVAHNTDLSFFEWVSSTPEMATLFVSYMKNVTSSEGTKIDHLVNGFDWAGLGKAKIVDMDGSNCHASVALAAAYPDLTFTVQDLAKAIVHGPRFLAKESEQVRARITCQEHDFFTPQPVTDADVYFLRMIFHDWSDQEALTILRHLMPILMARPMICKGKNDYLSESQISDGHVPSHRPSSLSSRRNSNGTGNSYFEFGKSSNEHKNSPPAAKTKPSHARLLIMDTVLPESVTQPSLEESLLRVRDLTTLQAFNSRERSSADWKNLFEAASEESAGDAGHLELVSTHRPFGSLMSLLELAFVYR